jgi:hypothetical protein
MSLQQLFIQEPFLTLMFYGVLSLKIFSCLRVSLSTWTSHEELSLKLVETFNVFILVSSCSSIGHFFNLLNIEDVTNLLICTCSCLDSNDGVLAARKSVGTGTQCFYYGGKMYKKVCCKNVEIKQLYLVFYNGNKHPSRCYHFTRR